MDGCRGLAFVHGHRHGGSIPCGCIRTAIGHPPRRASPGPSRVWAGRATSVLRCTSRSCERSLKKKAHRAFVRARGGLKAARRRRQRRAVEGELVALPRGRVCWPRYQRDFVRPTVGGERIHERAHCATWRAIHSAHQAEASAMVIGEIMRPALPPFFHAARAALLQDHSLATCASPSAAH